MSPKTPFIYLDHVADIRFIAYGKTPEEVFENAALATLSVIADISTIEPHTEFQVYLEADSLENLMVDFLSELLYLFEAEETVLGNVSVQKIRREKEPGAQTKYEICAAVSGEPINSALQNFKTEVKAVTYNDLRVEEKNGIYEAEVVLDL